MTLLQSFNFNNEIIDIYTEGDCNTLAFDLQKLLGGRVLELWSFDIRKGKRYGGPLHWFLQLTNGYVVDIFGIYNSPEDLLLFWQKHLANNYGIYNEQYEIRPLSELDYCSIEDQSHINILNQIVNIVNY